MQLEPRNRSLRAPCRHAASMTLVWICRLSRRNCAGWLRLASIPPTRAAARYTCSGRCSAKNCSTAGADCRSSSARVRSSSQASPAARSRRTSAEPTRPLWPATKILASGTVSSFPGLVDLESLPHHQRIALRQREVLRNHLAHQRLEVDLRSPAEFLARLAGITEERVHFGRPKIARIDANDRVPAARIEAALLHALALPFELHAERLGRQLGEFAHRMLLAGGDDEILGQLLLQHQPLRPDEVARMPPVTAGVEVSEEHALLESDPYAREAARDLAGHEG